MIVLFCLLYDLMLVLAFALTAVIQAALMGGFHVGADSPSEVLGGLVLIGCFGLLPTIVYGLCMLFRITTSQRATVTFSVVTSAVILMLISGAVAASTAGLKGMNGVRYQLHFLPPALVAGLVCGYAASWIDKKKPKLLSVFTGF
ncbi:hypothetical protein CCAX7_53540 [Capsulimonas corticalis]|uniref:Uncharacterized protein n=1 Tax=Capsulimonas corticalis TaxID=2219043 RepID=A0A402CNL5_9BACT|nr:hypothetical protein [Capsulimonas corticalis]BDI33303.1 hypothetical protein CCAX7_53540 [Capsulimonas corticalis]